mgnify:CR=1 FL=1
MTAEQVRKGGLGVWAPSVMPPIGVDLSDEQQMAVAFRHLASIGFAENMAGHITWQPDGRSDMYVNPWGLWWQELTASDICVVDEDARVVRGRWDVTPAIHIHTEIHRHRPDARVVIHNHPYYVSLIAALGTLPELVHQTGAVVTPKACFIAAMSKRPKWNSFSVAGSVSSRSRFGADRCPRAICTRCASPFPSDNCTRHSLSRRGSSPIVSVSMATTGPSRSPSGRSF